MRRDQIQSVLRHWCRRQEDSGPESAFHFQLYMGPNQKHLSAKYPKPTPTQETRTLTAKDKGKHKNTSPLDHSNVTPNPNGTRGAEDEWVRIDMGQMMMLRDLGHEVLGPINGPNEGLPQYEVPKSWLQSLELQINKVPTPTPFLTGDRPYLHPSPIPSRPSDLGIATAIDPALLYPMDPIPVAGPSIVDPVLDAEVSRTADSGSPLASDLQLESRGAIAIKSTIADLGGDMVQTGSFIAQTEPEPGSALGRHDTTPLGQLIHLPPGKPQTRSTQKRKVVTTDDLALLEAKELLKGGTMRRTRTRTQRKG